MNYWYRLYRFWLHRFVVRLTISVAIILVGWFGWWLLAPHEVVRAGSAEVLP